MGQNIRVSVVPVLVALRATYRRLANLISSDSKRITASLDWTCPSNGHGKKLCTCNCDLPSAKIHLQVQKGLVLQIKPKTCMYSIYSDCPSPGINTFLRLSTVSDLFWLESKYSIVFVASLESTNNRMCNCLFWPARIGSMRSIIWMLLVLRIDPLL